MDEIIFLVEEVRDGGFMARALGGSIFTEAETREELREAVRNAVRYRYAARERPALIRLHFVREEVIAA